MKKQFIYGLFAFSKNQFGDLSSYPALKAGKRRGRQIEVHGPGAGYRTRADPFFPLLLLT